jgi:hypothetical protein
MMTLSHPKHLTKALVALQYLQIVHTLSAHNVQADKRHHDLFVGEALDLRANREVITHGLEQTRNAEKLKVGGTDLRVPWRAALDRHLQTYKARPSVSLITSPKW